VKLLIFGGTGFLGSHTARYLIGQAHDVSLVIRTLPKARTSHCSVFEKASLIPWDDWEKLDFSRYDGILQMIGGVSAEEKPQAEIEELNFYLPRKIFEKATRDQARHYIQISSLSTRSGHGKEISELLSQCPRDTYYAQAKAKLENYLLENQEKIPLTILSPSYLLGEDDKYLTSNIVFVLLRMGRIKNFPDALKTFCHPLDVARTIEMAFLKKITGLFVLGGHSVSFEEFFQKSLASMNRPFALTKASAETLHSTFEKEFFEHTLVNDSKARDLLNFDPQITLDEMIERSILSLKKAKKI